MPDRMRVAAHLAITVDGRIATRRRTPSHFTSARDKHRLLEIRARFDAVCVGAATLAADRMTLALPDPGLRQARRRHGLVEEPLRVILSNSGRIDPTARVFETGDAPPTIYTTRQMPRSVLDRLSLRARVVQFDADSVPLRAALADLASHHSVRSLLCEGGPRLFRAFLAGGWIDRLFLTLAPRIFGGWKAPTLAGVLPPPLPRSLSARLEQATTVGAECFLEYSVRPRRLQPLGDDATGGAGF